ncbi:hypothetical protein SAMN04488104_101486 [Algoriphagus faecimaris]|uniref:6-bladed beta-propeller protein n=1 Tax=Algoriphagus faecimaris TaxID=686796 RepID=A0A1G6RXX2_9BACT|nr:hypothetical protein [Algoriphagus faecimaris]SDD09303.1 hypothetical protein SAMN04488104_101486 [Algoriphagus faecimaris]
MKTYLLLALITFCLFSCETSNQNAEEKLGQIPELTLVDSMQIDRLVVPTLLDYSEDGKHFLFFDFQSNELILTDPSGQILITANRTGDGPNSYKSGYFSACRFVGDDQILVETFSGTYLYDLKFTLKDFKMAHVRILSRMSGDTPGFVVDKNYQFKFGFLESDIDQIRVDDQWKMDVYDFLKVSDHESNELFSAPVPQSLNYLNDPGEYFSYDANALIRDDKLYLQFFMTPYLYEYKFPELVLIDSLHLNPRQDFKNTNPSPGDNFGLFFEELKGSRYENFVFSNDHLLTWYLRAAPAEEVDALDRRVVGDEKYQALKKKYKTPVYQIFKGKDKIWEGEWPIKLNVKKDLLYSVNAKPGEDPNAVERDAQTLYFYELR